MVMKTSQAEVMRSYEQALFAYIQHEHDPEGPDWIDTTTVLALMQERARVKKALSLWKEKERVRDFNEQ